MIVKRDTFINTIDSVKVTIDTIILHDRPHDVVKNRSQWLKKEHTS